MCAIIILPQISLLLLCVMLGHSSWLNYSYFDILKVKASLEACSFGGKKLAVPRCSSPADAKVPRDLEILYQFTFFVSDSDTKLCIFDVSLIS